MSYCLVIKKISLAIVILLAVVFLLNDILFKKNIKSTLKNTELFYSNNEVKITEIDDMVLYSFLSDSFDVGKKLEKNYLKNNLLKMWKKNLMNVPIKKDIKIDDLINKKYLFTKNDIFLNSLYCDVNGFTELDYFILNELRGDDGYNDTHFLIQSLLIDSLSCFDKNILKKDRDIVIQNIINAQNDDDMFSDLYAERIVVLAWSGNINSIEQAWIVKIIENQNADGSWSEPNNPGGIFHTTALSALSLKYYSEREVDNVWFVKQ